MSKKDWGNEAMLACGVQKPTYEKVVAEANKTNIDQFAQGCILPACKDKRSLSQLIGQLVVLFRFSVYLFDNAIQRISRFFYTGQYFRINRVGGVFLVQ